MNEVVRLLAGDAMEASKDNAGRAAVLLLDAAMALMLRHLDREGATEMTGMLASYLTEQMTAAVDAIHPKRPKGRRP